MYEPRFDPIHRATIQGFGCIQDLTVQLLPTPNSEDERVSGGLHALIGPNDSGKTTILRALRAAANGFVGLPERDPHLVVGSNITLDYAGVRGTFRVVEAGPVIEVGEWRDGQVGLQPASYHRFDARALRRPSPRIRAGEPLTFQSEEGFGLPGLLQAIQSRDVDAFVSIRDRVRTFFPGLDTLQVPDAPEPVSVIRQPWTERGHVVLRARLRDKQEIAATELSDGLLYFLAYLVLEQLEQTRIFLIEEPENGLHPSRIGDVIAALRELATRNQVILATHSPFVINELKPDEVTVVTRDAGGTKVTPIALTKNFERRAKVFELGELWVNYANGVDESPLLDGVDRT